MAEKAKKTVGKFEAEKLPDNWEKLSIERQYDAVNEKLGRLSDVDCDFDVRIKLLSYGSGRGVYSYIEWSNAGCVWDDADAEYRPCQFARRKPVRRGKLQLEDFPPELREELRGEDWEEDYDIPNIFDSRVEGKNWRECLERTFVRLELLKLGYELCWECEEYREEHRKFFEEHFAERKELYGDDDGDDDEDPDA